VATIAECLKQAELLAESSDSARIDIEVILCKALNKARAYLFTWPEKSLSESELKHFQVSLARRINGEPIAHIVGEKEFWTLTLKVNASTLIPRPDTELLVETALALLPDEAQTLIDLGTGTGAIALALASERPKWSLLAIDQSAEAVALAEDNRRAHRLENVSVLQSDWFAQVGASDFNAIISNPPYIDAKDEHLQQSDVKFEPHSALVAGNEGYSDLEHIAGEAWPRLATGGWLLLEHGYQQAPHVKEILAKCRYKNISTREDLAGMPRVTIGQKLSENAAHE